MLISALVGVLAALKSIYEKVGKTKKSPGTRILIWNKKVQKVLTNLFSTFSKLELGHLEEFQAKNAKVSKMIFATKKGKILQSQLHSWEIQIGICSDYGLVVSYDGHMRNPKMVIILTFCVF